MRADEPSEELEDLKQWDHSYFKNSPLSGTQIARVLKINLPMNVDEKYIHQACRANNATPTGTEAFPMPPLLLNI